MHAAEGYRCGDAQGTREGASALGEIREGVLDVVNDTGGPLLKGRPILGERKLARRAVEQPHAQAPLELGEAFAHDRFRQVQPPGGFTDRPRFRDRHEGRDAIELHCSAFPKSSSMKNNLIRTGAGRHTTSIGTEAPIRTLPRSWRTEMFRILLGTLGALAVVLSAAA